MPTRARDSAAARRIIRDRHRFDIDELADPEDTQLAPIPGTLDSTKRHARIGHGDGIDEDRAGLDLIDQARALRRIVRPRAARQAAVFALGSNSRVRSVKSRTLLGWTPRGQSVIFDIEHGSYRDAAAQNT